MTNTWARRLNALVNVYGMSMKKNQTTEHTIALITGKFKNVVGAV
jgi:hypothetical protein